MTVGYVLEKLLRFLEVENLCVFWVFLFWMPSIAFQPLATFIWNLLQKVSQFKIIVLNISLSFIYLFILACHVLVYAKQLVTQKAGNIFSSLPMLTSLISVMLFSVISSPAMYQPIQLLHTEIPSLSDGSALQWWLFFIAFIELLQGDQKYTKFSRHKCVITISVIAMIYIFFSFIVFLMIPNISFVILVSTYCWNDISIKVFLPQELSWVITAIWESAII